MLATNDPILTAHEPAAVSVALQDAGRSGLRGIGRFVFGTRRPTPLADPRLEAVRRFVCDTRRRPSPWTRSPRRSPHSASPER